jgi:hypothetical protein
MRQRWFAFAVGAALLGSAAPALAQEAPKTDSDPTKPVLFSVRPEFYRVDDNIWRTQVIARYDQATLRNRRWAGGKRGMLLRFELPMVTAETPADTSGSTGLGDAYAQLLLIPKLSGRFAFVAGTGLLLPTATNTILGGGKWTLAPAVLPVWFIRGVGMAFVKVQDFISIAGDEDRPDTHFMLITPTFIHTVGRSSWLLFDSETKTDWQRDGRTGVKSGLQWGWIVSPGFGLWVKPEVWWGQNRDGKWNLKTGFVWYRGRTAS